MPKMKPHSGMGKRVKLTGTGKVVAQSAGRVHKLEHKTSTHKRRMDGTMELAKVEVKRIKRLLGR
jgi:large subunit ribosomal protein L35